MALNQALDLFNFTALEVESVKCEILCRLTRCPTTLYHLLSLSKVEDQEEVSVVDELCLWQMLLKVE